MDHTHKGVFTVKSAYQAAFQMLNENLEEPSTISEEEGTWKIM